MTNLPNLSITFPDFLDEFFESDDKFLSPFSNLVDSFLSNNDNYKSNYGTNYFERKSYPKMDIIQTKTYINIKTELPGLKKKDISINIEDNPVIDGVNLKDCSKLTIKGDKQKPEIFEGDIFLVRELKHSAFTRSIYLNTNLVDVNSSSAKFDDGVLTITFKLLNPKKEEKKSEIKTLEIL